MQKLVDAPGGLREAKKRATRQQLTAAARQLTLAHGIDGVTVEMICAEVGVSVRTFFNYFASKDEALAGDPLPLGDEETRRRFVAGGPTGSLLADLMTVVDPTDALHRRGRQELRTGFELIMKEPRLLAQQLARGMEHEQQLAGLIAERQGSAAVDTFCLTAAALAQTVLRRAVADWVDADDDVGLRTHLDRVTRSASALLAPAAATPPTRPLTAQEFS